MNNVNGVGSGQQFFDATQAASSSSATRTVAADAGSAGLTGSGNASAVDQATLSATAGVMAQAFSGSDVRMDKVAALQQTIAAGTYFVTASDVGAKVMNALLN